MTTTTPMLSEEARAMILESLRAGVPLDRSARSVRASVDTVRLEAEADDGFAEALEAAEAEGEAVRLEAERVRAEVAARAAEQAVRHTEVAWSPGPEISRTQLGALVDLVGRLPLRQQDAIVAASRIDQIRAAAIARALAHHPAAARDVATALKEVEL